MSNYQTADFDDPIVTETTLNEAIQMFNDTYGILSMGLDGSVHRKQDNKNLTHEFALTLHRGSWSIFETRWNTEILEHGDNPKCRHTQQTNEYFPASGRLKLGFVCPCGTKYVQTLTRIGHGGNLTDRTTP